MNHSQSARRAAAGNSILGRAYNVILIPQSREKDLGRLGALVTASGANLETARFFAAFRMTTASNQVRHDQRRVRLARSAFTLIEMMAAMAVLGLLMVTIFGIFQAVSKAWLAGENRTETFQAARLAIQMMATELEGAISTTNNPSGSSARITFIINSNAGSVPGGGSTSATPPNDQLFFVAPASDSASSGSTDLTEYGYLVVFTGSNYLTMQGPGYYLLRHRATSNQSGGSANPDWDFLTNPTGWPDTPAIGSTTKVPIADNVLRLKISAFPSVSNPSDVLPRTVTVMICAIDRRTATRFNAIAGTSVLSSTELNKIPDNINNLSNPALANVLRGNVRTFYRTVCLRNAR